MLQSEELYHNFLKLLRWVDYAGYEIGQLQY